jgi:Spy/CpxP family protein refolding chaperone
MHALRRLTIAAVAATILASITVTLIFSAGQSDANGAWAAGAVCVVTGCATMWTLLGLLWIRDQTARQIQAARADTQACLESVRRNLTNQIGYLPSQVAAELADSVEGYGDRRADDGIQAGVVIGRQTQLEPQTINGHVGNVTRLNTPRGC